MDIPKDIQDYFASKVLERYGMTWEEYSKWCIEHPEQDPPMLETKLQKWLREKCQNTCS